MGGLTIFHHLTLEQVIVGDPKDDLSGVRHPFLEEVDLGGGNDSYQFILRLPFFHLNTATKEEMLLYHTNTL